MLSLEFLRLRRVGEVEAYAIGEDGKIGLRFPHVPYWSNVSAGLKRVICNSRSYATAWPSAPPKTYQANDPVCST